MQKGSGKNSISKVEAQGMGNFHNLDHRLLSFYKNYEPIFKNKTLILACSGGLDSMVNVALHFNLKKTFQWELVVAHVHHGISQDEILSTYRDKAALLAQKFSKDKGLIFVTYKNKKEELTSEAEFRKLRQVQLMQWSKQYKAAAIITGHHQQDMLETHLIHLIRGCGQEGLSGFKSYNLPWIRPLLETSSDEIASYAKEKEIPFVEDPSNQDMSYLRNWIRHKWLKDLEDYRAGATKALGRSLRILSLDAQTELLREQNLEAMDLSLYMTLSEAEKSQMLALFLSHQKVLNYSNNHILEFKKRLGAAQSSWKEGPFSMLGKRWSLKNNKLTLGE